MEKRGTSCPRLIDLHRNDCCVDGMRIVVKSTRRVVFDRPPNMRLVHIYDDGTVTISAEGEKYLRDSISRQTRWRIKAFLASGEKFVLIGNRLVNRATGGYISRYVADTLILEGSLVRDGDFYVERGRVV